MSMFITKIQIKNTNTPTEHSNSPNVIIVKERNGEEIKRFGSQEFTVISTRNSSIEDYKKNLKKTK